MTRRSLVLTGVAAVVVAASCVGVAVAPASATGHGSSVVMSAQHKPVKVTARPDKSQIRRGEHVMVRGQLSTDTGTAAAAPAGPAWDEPILVQELGAAGWTTISTDQCAPDGAFAINLSFAVSGSLTLRVFHPETDLYAAAFAEFGLVVL